MTRAPSLVDAIDRREVADDGIAGADGGAVVEQSHGLRQAAVVGQWREVETGRAGDVGMTDIQSAAANGWQGAVAQVKVHRDDVVGNDGGG